LSNGSWPWTHYAKWSLYKPLCPTYIPFKSLNPIKTWCSWLTVWLWTYNTSTNLAWTFTSL
jgi:hypothetical protein